MVGFEKIGHPADAWMGCSRVGLAYDVAEILRQLGVLPQGWRYRKGSIIPTTRSYRRRIFVGGKLARLWICG